MTERRTGSPEEQEAPRFAHYEPAQRERLQALIRTPEWQLLLARRAALQQWKADVTVPPAPPNQQEAADQYLQQRNAERVQRLLAEGVRDEDALVEALGDWQRALAGGDRFPIVFLGLTLTMDCSFLPRCLYCNQIWLPRRLRLDEWKDVVAEAARPSPPTLQSSTWHSRLTAGATGGPPSPSPCRGGAQGCPTARWGYR